MVLFAILFVIVWTQMSAIQCSLLVRTEWRNKKYTSIVHPHDGLPGNCANNAFLESKEKMNYSGRIPSPVALCALLHSTRMCAQWAVISFLSNSSTQGHYPCLNLIGFFEMSVHICLGFMA